MASGSLLHPPRPSLILCVCASWDAARLSAGPLAPRPADPRVDPARSGRFGSRCRSVAMRLPDRACRARGGDGRRGRGGACRGGEPQRGGPVRRRIGFGSRVACAFVSAFPTFPDAPGKAAADPGRPGGREARKPRSLETSPPLFPPGRATDLSPAQRRVWEEWRARGQPRRRQHQFTLGGPGSPRGSFRPLGVCHVSYACIARVRVFPHLRRYHRVAFSLFLFFFCLSATSPVLFRCLFSSFSCSRRSPCRLLPAPPLALSSPCSARAVALASPCLCS